MRPSEARESGWAEGCAPKAEARADGRPKARGRRLLPSRRWGAERESGPVPVGAGLFAAAVCAQMFASTLSLSKGNNPDAPRGLAKVTITR